jgi:hypothetical protein
MSIKTDIYDKFLNLLENFSTDQNEFKKLMHPDFLQIEYPNLITSKGRKRNLEDCLKGPEQAKKMLSEQIYKVKEYTEVNDKLVAEVTWTGKMAIDIGYLKKDQVLKAYICMVIVFKDDKIIQQRNYDCYEPFI